MRSYILTASALVAFANGQTWTLCNPMEKDCDNNPAIAETFESNFKDGEGALQGWKQTAKGTEFTDAGAVFSVKQKGDAPTIQSDGYLHFGYVEVTMKASKGPGIVSSIVLQSEDLDEVDWEFVGHETTTVQMNYFGKGNTTSYDRMTRANVPNIEEVHRYALNWTAESLTWIIDDVPQRTLKYEEANGGQNYPQTPCNVRIGIWAGGDSEDKGTQDWAGGKVDYSQAPFEQVVEKVKIINYSPGKEYEWTDKSGSWESIKVIEPKDASAPKPEPKPSATGAAEGNDTAATSTPCSDEIKSTPPPEETPCDCEVETVTVTGPPPVTETAPPPTDDSPPPPPSTTQPPPEEPPAEPPVEEPPTSTPCSTSSEIPPPPSESTPPPVNPPEEPEEPPSEPPSSDSPPPPSTTSPPENPPEEPENPPEEPPTSDSPPPPSTTPPPENPPEEPPVEEPPTSTPCSTSSEIPPPPSTTPPPVNPPEEPEEPEEPPTEPPTTDSPPPPYTTSPPENPPEEPEEPPMEPPTESSSEVPPPPETTPCSTTEVPPPPPVETPTDNCTTLVTTAVPPYPTGPTGGIIVETNPPPSGYGSYPPTPTGGLTPPNGTTNGTTPPFEFEGKASSSTVSYLIAVAAGLMVFAL